MELKEVVVILLANLITGKNYDIVILDLKMPDLDGVETIRRIREEADKASLKSFRQW